LSVTGPSGSGKLHVALEWLRSVGHPEPMVLDAGDLPNRPSWRREAGVALEGGGAVVLRRLEDLPLHEINAVKALGECVTSGACDGGPASPGSRSGGAAARLVITADVNRCPDAILAALAQITSGADLPPLSSRDRDIPKIVDALLEHVPAGRRPILSAATLQVLLKWHWPGNVAELRCLVDELARERPGQCVSPYHLPERMSDAAHKRMFTRIQLAERAEIVAALRQTHGNRSEAAILLGIGRTTLYRKLRALGIEDNALMPATAQPAGG
jgi:hypothetical protein